MEKTVLRWQAFEYIHREKTPDWYWAVGIIAVAIAVTAVLLSDVLFAILILLGAFSLALFAGREPLLVSFEINQKGIAINDLLYPYGTLDSFWVNDLPTEHTPKLLLKSKKVLVPHIVIPIENISPEEIREFLISKIKEEEQHEPPSQKLMEHLGF